MILVFADKKRHRTIQKLLNEARAKNITFQMVFTQDAKKIIAQVRREKWDRILCMPGPASYTLMTNNIAYETI